MMGRVTVTFIVDFQGNVNNVKVVRGVSKILDEEAIRVIKMSPKWEPGIQKGKPVNVRYNFPVIFKLQ
jgi:TonB family protein